MKRYTGLFKYAWQRSTSCTKPTVLAGADRRGLVAFVLAVPPVDCADGSKDNLLWRLSLGVVYPGIGEFFRDALIHAIFAFLFTSAVLSLFAVLLSSRHRLDALERAGIAVE